jgi:glycosyltransferase involved in cell wall biosynthesis
VQEPLVSVILPVRNGARYVAQAVRSILAQTCPDLELIVIDDGSTDDTPAQVLAAGAGDPRLLLLSHPPSGVAIALNHGCAQARGQFLARMDADDIALPQRLAHQAAFLQQHPTVAVVGARALVLRDDHATDLILGGPTAPRDVAACLRHENCLIHPTVMLRREVFMQLGGYRPLCADAEDLDLWLRLAERHELANLPDVLLHYRLHDRQVSHAAVEQMALSNLGAYALAQKRRQHGVEPTITAPRIDRTVLADLGVTPQAIEEAVLDILLARALLYRKAGLAAPAQSFYAQFRQSAAAGRQTLRRRAWRHWAQGRYACISGRRATAAAHLSLALLLRPSLAGQAWRLCRRRSSMGG